MTTGTGRIEKKSTVSSTAAAGKKTVTRRKQQNREESAPTPNPSPHSDLWADFERTARRLANLCDFGASSLNHAALAAVMMRCLHMLRVSANRGKKDAVMSLFGATSAGCEFLAKAATNENCREVLKAFASRQTEWPVMLSLKQSSSKAATEYLRRIAVGTASNPPTAGTKITIENPWTRLAVMLIANIRWYRTVLEMQGQVTGSDFIQGLFDRWRPKASLWRMILKLPIELNRETEVKWWAVAKLMLKDYWLANPEEAKTTFRQLELSCCFGSEDAKNHRNQSCS